MLSSGDWTRLQRLKGSKPQTLSLPVVSISGAAIGENNQGATAMVLACIDPRYTTAVEQFLVDQLDSQHYYDLFSLAGASLSGGATGTTGALYSPYKCQEVFYEHLQIAVILHNIQNIWVFDHLDCGAYKTFYSPPLGTTDCLKQPHINVFNYLKTKIASSGIAAISGLNVQGWIVDSPECGGQGTFYGVTGSTAVSTGISETIPPSSGATVLVLGCIDPRYSSLLSSFLLKYKDVQFNYDLFNLAGASLGVNQSYKTDGTLRAVSSTLGSAYSSNMIPQFGVNWGPVFLNHLDIALALHGITDVWAFDHLDCGAYKRIKFGSASATDLAIDPHTEELQLLRVLLKARNPTLAFKGFVMDMSGNITKVVDSGNGIQIPPLKDPGSLITRNPASSFTDLKAFYKADFLTKTELVTTGNTRNTRIIGYKLCSTGASCGQFTVHSTGLCPKCR